MSDYDNFSDDGGKWYFDALHKKQMREAKAALRAAIIGICFRFMFKFLVLILVCLAIWRLA